MNMLSLNPSSIINQMASLKCLETPISPLYFNYNKLVEYLLIISPPDFIKNDVAWYKDWLAKQIGYYDARFSMAHLTIAAFLLARSKEKALLRSLKDAIAKESNITFNITGFDVFYPNNTFFLKIEERESFSKVSKNINLKSVLSGIPSRFKFLTYVPHLTIGKNLNNNFHFAYCLLKDKSYTQTFTAQSALLLKKERDKKFCTYSGVSFSCQT